MAIKENLEVGKIYYHMLFKDKKMQVPIIQTVVYAGHDIFYLDDLPVDQYYFQDFDSFNNNGLIISLDEGLGHEYLVLDEELLNSIYDLCELSGKLNRIEKRKWAQD